MGAVEPQSDEMQLVEFLPLLVLDQPRVVLRDVLYHLPSGS